jgi:DNA-binding response OmpR family regulator
MKEKILIAEDEKELAKALKAILEYSNYNVSVVYNGKDALEKTKENNFDVIIMDIMMPIMDGITSLKEMRKDGINTPIILLTAKSQVDDKVEGLDAGANDYLTKPFNKKELLARIRALTRVEDEKKEKYSIGNIIFNKENSEISNNKAVFHLNNKECEIMEVLIKNQERNITANELSQKIWQTGKNEESAVTMYISYLQEKFSALNANIIINDKNGYILENKL